jgi:hypothetical protein
MYECVSKWLSELFNSCMVHDFCTLRVTACRGIFAIHKSMLTCLHAVLIKASSHYCC